MVPADSVPRCTERHVHVQCRDVHDTKSRTAFTMTTKCGRVSAGSRVIPATCRAHRYTAGQGYEPLWATTIWSEAGYVLLGHIARQAHVSCTRPHTIAIHAHPTPRRTNLAHVNIVTTQHLMPQEEAAKGIARATRSPLQHTALPVPTVSLTVKPSLPPTRAGGGGQGHLLVHVLRQVHHGGAQR